MGSVQKGLLQLRATLKLPRSPRDGRSGRREPNANSTIELLPTALQHEESTDVLQELIEKSLWPMVETAFRDTEEQVEARFFQLDDLQVVISRAPARGAVGRDAARRVTLELWPPAGPRILVVEWSGRRPYVVHRRDGDWLQRLRRKLQQSK